MVVVVVVVVADLCGRMLYVTVEQSLEEVEGFLAKVKSQGHVRVRDSSLMMLVIT